LRAGARLAMLRATQIAARVGYDSAALQRPGDMPWCRRNSLENGDSFARE